VAVASGICDGMGKASHFLSFRFLSFRLSIGYFTRGQYRDEINSDNPLGMQGRMANVYANLVRKVNAAACEYLVRRVYLNE
jgi:hypothetical protein